MRRIKVGSRSSKLAQIQAKQVMDTIEKYHPDSSCQLVLFSSAGDEDQSKSLEAFGQPNLFSDQLEQSLIKGEIDLAVHSYKDLPYFPHPLLPIVATGSRANPFDALVKGAHPTGKGYGTSCKRRSLQFMRLYPHLKTAPIRGSVDQRMAQMEKGDYDGLILAVAGLERLGLQGTIHHIFSLEEMVPSACQGILAVQGRKGTDYSYLKEYHCPDSHTAAQGERGFLQQLDKEGEGYNQGVYGRIIAETQELHLTGLYLSPQGEFYRGEIKGPPIQAAQLGKSLATRLRKESLWLQSI